MANEKRLIDANELPLGKFIEPRTEWHQGWNDALDAAALQAPTVDAVEVVRCKDCKHWHDSWVAPDGEHTHGECYIEDADDVIVGRWDDDFCSYGERKDNETD